MLISSEIDFYFCDFTVISFVSDKYTYISVGQNKSGVSHIFEKNEI